MIEKKLNTEYLGGSPNIPESGHDRYYDQDLQRDFNFLRDQIGRAFKNMNSDNSKIIVSGGVVSHVAGQKQINVTAFVGYAPLNISIPDSWSSLPPTITTGDVDLVEIVSAALNAFDLTLDAGFVADGGTPNYIKFAYAEDDIALSERDRAHGTGSYISEKKPTSLLTVNTTAPTDYEICLGTLICSADGNTMTFSNDDRDFDLYIDTKIQIFTASRTWKNKFGATLVRVICVGKGGAGGNSASGGGGSGGGGSGSIRMGLISVSGDATITINGSLTSFVGETTLSAQAGYAGITGNGSGDGGGGGSGSCGGGGGGGGGAGLYGAGGNGGNIWDKGDVGSAGTGIDSGAGGAGGNGGVNYPFGIPCGFTGGIGGTGGEGGGYGGGGGGGAGFDGAGGAGGNSGQAGVSGHGYGAGGGGAGGHSNGAGGAGGGGVCIVEIIK